MSHQVTLSLTDQEYEAVRKSAFAVGRTPEEWIATQLADLLSEVGSLANSPDQTSPVIREVLESLAIQSGVAYTQLESDWHAKYGVKLPLAASAQRLQELSDQLYNYVGAASLGYASGADNASIDADLAREYGSGPEN